MFSCKLWDVNSFIVECTDYNEIWKSVMEKWSRDTLLFFLRCNAKTGLRKYIYVSFLLISYTTFINHFALHFLAVIIFKRSKSFDIPSSFPLLLIHSSLTLIISCIKSSTCWRLTCHVLQLSSHSIGMCWCNGVSENKN